MLARFVSGLSQVATGLALTLSASTPARAGEGGCLPPEGGYRFIHLDPPPTVDRGRGEFKSDGSATVTPNGQADQLWVQGQDGQYRRDGGDENVSFCVQDGSPLAYSYKYLGEPLASGWLVPEV